MPEYPWGTQNLSVPPKPCSRQFCTRGCIIVIVAWSIAYIPPSSSAPPQLHIQMLRRGVHAPLTTSQRAERFQGAIALLADCSALQLLPTSLQLRLIRERITTHWGRHNRAETIFMGSVPTSSRYDGASGPVRLAFSRVFCLARGSHSTLPYTVPPARLRIVSGCALFIRSVGLQVLVHFLAAPQLSCDPAPRRSGIVPTSTSSKDERTGGGEWRSVQWRSQRAGQRVLIMNWLWSALTVP